jgi:N-acetylmuramic acid 6-phosphate etherase
MRRRFTFRFGKRRMDHLLTEARNPASTHLDELSALEIVRLMNAEDALVPPAVAGQAAAIAQAIDVIAERLGRGGRLVYAGAGTSGRLGVLDATECPPTFNTPPGQVIGVIAGGPRAITQAVEGAEDHPEFAEQDLAAVNLGNGDVLVGIATSGRTPYVLGAADYARRVGAYAIGLSCNPDSELNQRVDLAITVPVGPEVLSGSTRLKAGTATKLVLNMLTTGAMVRLGKAYGNLMVDLRATNEKLRARTNRIVRHLTGLAHAEADALLQRCGGELKTALVAHLSGSTPEQARERLAAAGGQVREALASYRKAAQPAAHPDVVLGIDGGGSHTTALLARGDLVLGRGLGGPSNLQTVGVSRAFASLDQAVEQAFAAAGMPRETVAAACLGLAGADRSEDREVIRGWSSRVALAGHVDVTSDAALLLAAGTPEGWGLAVIAGTGSIAFARAADGRTARAGGWGYLLGDEGSGYAIAVAGLQAVARATDGRGAATVLTKRLLAALELEHPQQLIGCVYGKLDRPAIAALAPLVLDASAAGDAVAQSLVEHSAAALADTVVAAAQLLFGCPATVPVALAGSVLVHHTAYQARFLTELHARGITGAPVTPVPEPAVGAVRLAASCRAGGASSS